MVKLCTSTAGGAKVQSLVRELKIRTKKKGSLAVTDIKSHYEATITKTVCDHWWKNRKLDY